VDLPFHDNWLSMVTRLSWEPSVQSITLQTQVESAMRQRPDIIILGEIRSREAYTFFHSVSTGHGGMTTVHAESFEALIRRLTSPPMSVPKSLVASARLFVHLLRVGTLGSATRKVVAVYEIDDYDPSRDVIKAKLSARWIRPEDRWVYARSFSTIRWISRVTGVSEEELEEDLAMRATVLAYAASRKLDIASLHVLLRRYRRNPKEVFHEAVRSLGKPFEVSRLEEEVLLEV